MINPDGLYFNITRGEKRGNEEMKKGKGLKTATHQYT